MQMSLRLDRSKVCDNVFVVEILNNKWIVWIASVTKKINKTTLENNEYNFIVSLLGLQYNFLYYIVVFFTLLFPIYLIWVSLTKPGYYKTCKGGPHPVILLIQSTIQILFLQFLLLKDSWLSQTIPWDCQLRPMTTISRFFYLRKAGKKKDMPYS